MRQVENALVHLKEAATRLRLEAYRLSDRGTETEDAHFTIAEELERVDRALGPSGQSMFAGLADCIRDAYVEIIAAEACLQELKS